MQWGLCALCRVIPVETILACCPLRLTEWLAKVAIWCELWCTYVYAQALSCGFFFVCFCFVFHCRAEAMAQGVLSSFSVCFQAKGVLGKLGVLSQIRPSHFAPEVCCPLIVSTSQDVLKRCFVLYSLRYADLKKSKKRFCNISLGWCLLELSLLFLKSVISEFLLLHDFF